MRKTRVLNSDLGDRPDGKYLSSTAGVYIPSVTWSYLEDNFLYEYVLGKGKASSTIVPPNGFGFESIESTTRPKPQFNDVYHEKKKGFNYPYFLCTLVPGQTYGAWQPYWRVAMNGSFSTIPTHINANWSDVSDIQRRAWWTMQPRFESEFSFLNFVYEMKDFKHLALALVKPKATFDKFKNLNKFIGKHIGKGRALANFGNSLAGISKALAKTRLFINFEVQPLLNDLAEIAKIYAQTVTAAQEEFSARGLDRQSTHYSENLGTTSTGSWGTGNSAWLFTGSKSTSFFTATLEYSYDYTMRVGWDMYSTYLGANVTAERIWNGIPFSFLVDYFCKVGDALHAMSLDPNVRLNLLQYCESIVKSAHIGKACNPKASCVKIFHCPSTRYSELSSYVPIAGYLYEIFERRVTQPNKGAALPRFKRPSSTQTWNLVALVRAMMR